jgi:hypothetical protein
LEDDLKIIKNILKNNPVLLLLRNIEKLARVEGISQQIHGFSLDN